MKTFYSIIHLLIVSLFCSCTQSGKEEKQTEKPEIKTYSDWVAKSDDYNPDIEYYRLTIPDYFRKNSDVTLELKTIKVVSDQPNSSISLIDKNGNYLATLYEPTRFHETAILNTIVSVGDIDGNGVNDIKFDFPYTDNKLMTCATRSVYLFQEADKTFNKISFDSFVSESDISEIDLAGEGRHYIVARNLQYLDDDNHYLVGNLYKYTPDGLVCVSEENGYPKAVNADKTRTTNAEIVNKHKKEWTLPLPDKYHFSKSTDPEAAEGPKTVVDMFLLLPDDAFNGAYPRPVREKMAEYKDRYLEKEYESLYYKYGGLRNGFQENELHIVTERDTPEGFIYFWQFPGSRRLVTLLDDSLKLEAYWYERGKLEKDNDFYAFVNENSNFTCGDFYEFDLSNAAEEDIPNDDLCSRCTMYKFDVSENGNITITVSNIIEELYVKVEKVYDVRFEHVDGKWEKSRILSRDFNSE